MERDVRVLAVDDQDVFRRVCSRLVDETAGFCWAGSARSGAEALERVEELDPDLALVDVRMPDMDGLETTRRLVQRRPQLVVVLVSVADSDDLPAATAAAGAVAHVPKNRLSPGELRRLWATHGPASISR
jgi:CheY-like chemotaxis protein